MNRIFLTGGTGFIGSNFLRQAMASGHQIVALRQSASSRPKVSLPCEPLWLEKPLQDVAIDDLRGCAALVHFAAVGAANPVACSWDEAFRVNVTASLRLLVTAADAGIRRIIVCGSCFEYGRAGERYKAIPTSAPLEPTGPYHASKAAATLAAYALAVERKIEMLIIRPFHVFGEGEAEHRFWPSLRRAAFAGEDFPMTMGEQMRDFIPVRDVANLCVNALADRDIRPGEPLIENVGTGVPTTLRDFAAGWWKEWNATGDLMRGVIPYRSDEVINYVPQISDRCRRWMSSDVEALESTNTGDWKLP